MTQLEKAIIEKVQSTKQIHKDHEEKDYLWASSCETESLAVLNLDYKSVCRQIDQSYEKSLEVLSSSISCKIKYLNTMKL